MDPESENFMYAPIYWQNDVGSVLVTRIDGGEITPQTVQAICAYNKEVFEEKMQPASEGESLKEQKEVVGSITAGGFDVFFKEFQERQLQRNPDWAANTEPVMMTSGDFEEKAGTKGAQALPRGYGLVHD